MESQCHTGKQCVYDTVGDRGWRVGIGNHKIRNVIESVIKVYDEVPECVPDDECVDCFNWKFFESNGSDSTTTRTSTTSSTTRTRTSTCKTPGWWGCLDESSTTTTTSTPIITTTYTTTTCVSPGWFGCNEKTNVTITTTTLAPTVTAPTTSVDATTTPSSTSTPSCGHPGWWGCRDPTSTHKPSPSPTSTHATKTPVPTTCETPGYFYGCYDRPRHTSPKDVSITSSTPLITEAPTPSASSDLETPTSTHSDDGGKTRRRCKHPVFFGLFCLDGYEEESVQEL